MGNAKKVSREALKKKAAEIVAKARKDPKRETNIALEDLVRRHELMGYEIVQ